MKAQELKGAISCISKVMTAQRDYLVELDSQNGDGDLGISMSSGYQAIDAYLKMTDEADLGRLMMQCSSVFNEAAPSSLGTIMSFGMIGMAKNLKGKTEISVDELADALQAGVSFIMEKAKSKPGEKTILDALCPAVEVLKANSAKSAKEAFDAAAKAASEGSEKTKEMRSVHGRAAYYGDKSIGILDGGSVVGKLLFTAIADYLA
ncbi:MAG: dihydroxyacetone kinase subunit L [Hungatella sp.]